MKIESRRFAKLIGKAIFYASLQASIGSVEMSSKFSVMNFSKDQLTLDRAVDALRSYMWIAFAWTAATMLTLYSTDGLLGAFMGLLANAIMIAWIYFSYLKAFKYAASQHGLVDPPVFSSTDLKILGGLLAVLIGGICLWKYSHKRKN
jgi:hypothetical protein